LSAGIIREGLVDFDGFGLFAGFLVGFSQFQQPVAVSGVAFRYRGKMRRGRLQLILAQQRLRQSHFCGGRFWVYFQSAFKIRFGVGRLPAGEQGLSQIILRPELARLLIRGAFKRRQSICGALVTQQ